MIEALRNDLTQLLESSGFESWSGAPLELQEVQLHSEQLTIDQLRDKLGELGKVSGWLMETSELTELNDSSPLEHLKDDALLLNAEVFNAKRSVRLHRQPDGNYLWAELVVTEGQGESAFESVLSDTQTQTKTTGGILTYLRIWKPEALQDGTQAIEPHSAWLVGMTQGGNNGE